MDAETLLRLGTDPVAWIRQSATLRRSADALWDAFVASTVNWAMVQNTDKVEEAPDRAWDTAIGHLTSAKMLYGLALETALKATIIRNHPADVEFKLTADGTGKVQHAELKQLGVSLGTSHDLVKLAERAGVFRRGGDEIFVADSDYVATRAILEDLGEVVVWAARYPIPLRSGQTKQVSTTTPARVFGHYMRDWTDPLLDNLYRSIGSGIVPNESGDNPSDA